MSTKARAVAPAKVASASSRPCSALSPIATAASSSEPPTAYASLEGGLRSLFQTDRRQGAISDGVAKIWQNRAAANTASRSAPTYFPRSDAAGEADAPVAASVPAPAAITPDAPAAAAIVVPLPPRRPAGLGGTVAAPLTSLAAGPTPDRPNATASQAKSSLFDSSSYRLRNGS